MIWHACCIEFGTWETIHRSQTTWEPKKGNHGAQFRFRKLFVVFGVTSHEIFSDVWQTFVFFFCACLLLVLSMNFESESGRLVFEKEAFCHQINCGNQFFTDWGFWRSQERFAFGILFYSSWCFGDKAANWWSLMAARGSPKAEGAWPDDGNLIPPCPLPWSVHLMFPKNISSGNNLFTAPACAS